MKSATCNNLTYLTLQKLGEALFLHKKAKEEAEKAHVSVDYLKSVGLLK